MTEAALACHELHPCNSDPVGSGFYEAQADFVVWLYVRNWANNIDATLWFTLNEAGWRHTSLLNKDLSPKPAYLAYQFLTQEIGGGAYLGRINTYPDLRAYAFEKGGKRVWVLWAPDQVEHVITLPGGVSRLVDKYGNPIVLSPGQTSLGVKSPVYLEFQPTITPQHRSHRDRWYLLSNLPRRFLFIVPGPRP